MTPPHTTASAPFTVEREDQAINPIGFLIGLDVTCWTAATWAVAEWLHEGLTVN